MSIPFFSDVQVLQTQEGWQCLTSNGKHQETHQGRL